MLRALFIFFSMGNITVSLLGLFNNGSAIYLVNLFYTIFSLVILKKVFDFIGKVKKNSRDIKDLQKEIEELKAANTPESQMETVQPSISETESK